MLNQNKNSVPSKKFYIKHLFHTILITQISNALPMPASRKIIFPERMKSDSKTSSNSLITPTLMPSSAEGVDTALHGSWMVLIGKPSKKTPSGSSDSVTSPCCMDTCMSNWALPAFMGQWRVLSTTAMAKTGSRFH